MSADRRFPNPPVDPALTERVARALAGESAENPIIAASWLPKAQDLIAALTTEDLKALLQARSALHPEPTEENE